MSRQGTLFNNFGVPATTLFDSKVGGHGPGGGGEKLEEKPLTGVVWLLRRSDGEKVKPVDWTSGDPAPCWYVGVPTIVDDKEYDGEDIWYCCGEGCCCSGGWRDGLLLGGVRNRCWRPLSRLDRLREWIELPVSCRFILYRCCIILMWRLILFECILFERRCWESNQIKLKQMRIAVVPRIFILANPT